MLTIFTDSAIEAVMPRARAAILALLLLNPTLRLHLRAIARETKMSATFVRKEANGLVDAGIISSERSGNRVYYRANTECPIYNELKGIIIKTYAIHEPILRALKPLESRIELAYIFGSFADGSSKTTSDIDLMVVGDVEFGEVVDAIADAEETVSREISPTVYSSTEYNEKLKLMNGFVYRVHNGSRIDLIGAVVES